MRIEQWLASVRVRTIWLTLIVAWALSFLTSRQTVWLDWMGFILLFWTVYQPTRVSMGLAFVLGVLMDVQQTSLLGEHALMYVALVYLMRELAPRLQFASILAHSLYATGLMLLVQLMRALVHFLTGSTEGIRQIGWIFVSVLAWLVLAWILSRGDTSRKDSLWMKL